MPPQKKTKRKAKDKNNIIAEPTTTNNILGPVINNIIHEPSTNIINEQDTDYEMSMLMDMIKFQEKEDKKREEDKKILEKMRAIELKQRDQNIKDILRKIKITTKLLPIEKTIIELLESFMESLETQIIIDDSDLYDQIFNYLGLGERKGIVRLSNEIKEFTQIIFIKNN
jgi:hypothetical protein